MTTNSKIVLIDRHPGRSTQTIGIARALGTDPDLIHEPSVGVVGTKGDSQCYLGVLDKVEAVTIAVAKEVLTQVQGGVATFEPFIRYNAFSDSSINFNVILRGREFVDQHLIRHEFIKRLHVRFQAERIEIPFPQRTVHLHQVKPPARAGAAP